MKLRVKKQRERTALVYKNEQRILLFKFFKKFFFLNKAERFYFLVEHLKIFEFRNSLLYYSRLKNCCVITSRAKAIFRRTKMSRIIMRYFLKFGLFAGWQKSSF
jgi:ribosomal protein S14